jgi:hypothetical protein
MNRVQISHQDMGLFTQWLLLPDDITNERETIFTSCENVVAKDT